MGDKETAENLCRWLEPMAEPAGVAGAPEGCVIDDLGNVIRDAKPMLIRETRGFFHRNWPVWVGLVLGSVLGYVVGVAMKGAMR